MRDLREISGVSRRTILIAAAEATPLLAMMTSGAKAGVKVSPDAVHYQPTPKDGQDCGHCYHFVTPGSCKLVDGAVSPNGWCRLWVKKVA
jgi:hypothetical protein